VDKRQPEFFISRWENISKYEKIIEKHILPIQFIGSCTFTCQIYYFYYIINENKKKLNEK